MKKRQPIPIETVNGIVRLDVLPGSVPVLFDDAGAQLLAFPSSIPMNRVRWVCQLLASDLLRVRSAAYNEGFKAGELAGRAAGERRIREPLRQAALILFGPLFGQDLEKESQDDWEKSHGLEVKG